MKKSQIRILAILAAIALLLGIALFALRYEKKPEVLPPLAECDSSDIINLTYSNQSGTFSFQKYDGSWCLGDDAVFPVNQETLEKMLDVLCTTRPQTVVEKPDLEELGFTSPQCTISYNHNSGSGTIHIGSMNAVTDQLYVLTNNTVYLTDTTLLQAFSGSLLDIAQQFPIPKPENHRSVTVENTLGTITLSCDSTQTGGQEGVWFLQTGDGWVEADQNAAYNFYFLTYDMHWKSTAAVVTGETNLADYGLDNPQAVYTLTYGDETFRLHLGKNLPDGTTYAMCDGDTLIYTMDTLLAKWLAEATSQLVLPQ